MKRIAAHAMVSASAMLIVGCSASEVRRASPNAPSNQDGEITYCAGGAKKVRDARRDDAYRKMREHCGGEYSIVS